MSERPYESIVVVAHGGVCRITLNRPDRRNALGPVMVNELLWALEDATNDEAVRSIVITGAGKAFCAGGDFSQMAGGDAPKLPPKGAFDDLLLALVGATKPVVARVNGAAMGGGLGIVAASTFAVASTDAKLGTPEIGVGLFPFMILAVLERVVPRRRLVEMLLTGEKLDADEAARVGLVNRAVAPEALDAAVDGYTASIASRSPLTVRLGLEAMRDTADLSLKEKLPVLSARLSSCLSTDDAREGLMAFLEKRPPRWTGR
ncbi:MAG TPA: enoyl-CoA hydratase-related protein [Polyangiaceae bacterium]|jgi:enoyl-CoA hydratase/carnithine racemase|nr:enoyl-CoA hydratase-related protein [Polyangiaceae bacterium]